MKVTRFLSICFLAAACNTDTGKNSSKADVVMLADSVTVFFYNTSLSPAHQFYSTLKLFKWGYTCSTEYGNPAYKSVKEKVFTDSALWVKTRAFSPDKLYNQNMTDGECFSISYYYNDSIYQHFPPVISEKEQELISLIKTK